MLKAFRVCSIYGDMVLFFSAMDSKLSADAAAADDRYIHIFFLFLSFTVYMILCQMKIPKVIGMDESRIDLISLQN